MKKNISQILSVVLLLLMLVSVATVSAVAAETVSKAGDVNFDGELNSDDTRLILRASVGLEKLTNEQYAYADIDRDGKISASDARLCIRAVVGLEILLPVVTDIPIVESTVNYLPSDDAITAESKYEYGEHTLEIKVNDWASFCCGDFELKYDDSINITNITMPYLYNSVYAYNDSDGIRFSYAISDNSQSSEESASLLTITFEKTTLEKVPEFTLGGKARFDSERYVSIDKKIIAEQKCGDNLTWKFKEATGELIVEGTGDMTSAPWWGLDVESVSLPEGLTSITASAFVDCWNLTKIIIPDSVKTIGSGAFAAGHKIQEINIPASLEYVGANAFRNCELIEEFVLPNSVEYIGDGAFSNCATLIKLVILNPDCNIILTAATIPENTIIYGEVNSTAHAYAKQFHREFREFNPDCLLSFVPELPASCGVVGTKAYYTCSHCDKLYIDSNAYTSIAADDLTIPALTHKYIKISTLPTCSTKGYTTNICINCNDYFIDNEVSANGHKLGEYKPYFPASCTSVGENRADCENCDYYEIERIPVAPHNFTETIYVPTCVSEGFTLYYCADCNMTYLNNFVLMLAHEDFEGDGLCDYCETEVEDVDDDLPECDHICHKSGFLGFIWKVISFFQKLFGISPICECGVAHY